MGGKQEGRGNSPGLLGPIVLRPGYGQLLSLVHRTKPPFERLVHSETCRMFYGSISAGAAVGTDRVLRQQRGGLLTMAALSNPMAASRII